MTMKKKLKHYVGRKTTRRIYQAMPWVGGLVALAAIRSAVGRKRLGGGTLETVDSEERETDHSTT